MNLDSERIMRSRTIEENEKIQELLRNDPFIALWENNYRENFEQGLLSNDRTRPLSFITNTSSIKNVPVVAIAAGPSIDKNIDAIKGYEDKCIIVCADVILFKLIERGIKPDFIVNIDPHESISRFWNFLDTSDLTLVCPNTASPKALQSWQGKVFLYNQEDTPGTPKGDALRRITKTTAGWGRIFNRFFVGATITDFAMIFRPNPLILAGYDFAYTDGKAYCDGFLDIKIYHLEDPVGSEEHTKMIEKLKKDEVKKEVEVYASKEEPSVWTSKTLYFYKKSYSEFITKLGFPIINATEGGILTEVPRKPLAETLKEYCTKSIGNKDFFSPPKRKKKKRRR